MHMRKDNNTANKPLNKNKHASKKLHISKFKSYYVNSERENVMTRIN